jgi:hypothetical protein
MDKIITNLRKELGYRMGNNPINIMCKTGDAVLIADSVENVQNLLLKFDQMADSLNMEISLSKGKGKGRFSGFIQHRSYVSLLYPHP